MASTFTPNLQLEEPARGDDVGVWDTPVNGNMSLVDKVAGAINVISLNNSPVVLSAAQFQSRQITFNSTLTGSVTITFPTSFTKSYEIQNVCTGSSAFVITLLTTAAGGQFISCPPGETIECFNDGTNIKFKNFGRIGSYWDYAGSSVPGWVTGCAVSPYLNCDGSAFSAVTYPALAVILGGTTLPDQRGRYRAAINQGTGRITSGISGVDGNTALAVGSSQTVALTQANLPSGVNLVSNAQQVSVFVNILNTQRGSNAGTIVTGMSATGGGGTDTAAYPVGGQTVPLGGSGTATPIIPPTLMGGLTLIRSA